jgi:hypothetical protein
VQQRYARLSARRNQHEVGDQASDERRSSEGISVLRPRSAPAQARVLDFLRPLVFATGHRALGGRRGGEFGVDNVERHACIVAQPGAPRCSSGALLRVDDLGPQLAGVGWS